jgi:hypothetical protein
VSIFAVVAQRGNSGFLSPVTSVGVRGGVAAECGVCAVPVGADVFEDGCDVIEPSAFNGAVVRDGNALG